MANRPRDGQPPLVSATLALILLGVALGVIWQPRPFASRESWWVIAAAAYAVPAFFWGCYGAWRQRDRWFPYRHDPDRWQRLLGWFLGLVLLPAAGAFYGIFVGGLAEFFRYWSHHRKR